MDFGKFRYDEGMKRKQARKQQQKQVIKEIKFHASVDPHDLEVKMRRMREFIAAGNKVKVTLAYRGRENAHKDLGFEVMQRVIEDMSDVTFCEQQPKLLGRFLGCLLSPRSQKSQQRVAAERAEKGEKADKSEKPHSDRPHSGQPHSEKPHSEHQPHSGQPHSERPHHE